MAGGGAERQLTYLVRELVQLNWDVHVALVHGGPNLTRLQATGATVHEVHALGNYDPRIFVRLIGIIRSTKPDVVQCWLLQMEVLGGVAAHITGVPWIFSERASELAYPRTFKMWLRRKAGAAATAIVANSREGDRYWQDQVSTGVRRYVIPNGLPLEEIERAPRADDMDAHATDGEPLVLNAGRFEYQKNFETFVRALRFVAAERPVQALCCGDGSLRSRVQQLAGDLGLSEQVHFTGYASNLWSLIKRADVLVSTSFFEGSPNVVLEAMACGCPLVVSDIPTHREILDDDSAVFVDPRNPREIADAIIRVLNDSDGAARRAMQARARVQRYSTAGVARQYAQVYGDISTRGSDCASTAN
jgi:glycosyltransferase involved in cell wall biosynthesis